MENLRHLDFCPPDLGKFPCLRLAYEAADAGGAKTIALNASDEIAVAAFLEGRIAFPDIAGTIESVLRETNATRPESIKEVLALDAEARRCASRQVEVFARNSRVKSTLPAAGAVETAGRR